MSKVIRIGTRGSKLALWQAEHTQARLREIGVDSELVIIETKGDRIQDLSFDKIEGKGFFTKEIEEVLLRGDVDVAAHSMKDLPTSSPEGLTITALSYREDPTDWLLVRKEAQVAGQLFGLPQNAVVGTSSARRKAQMLGFRSDVEIRDLRGNVPTRIEKLRRDGYDAILLAAAGLQRLEMDLSEFEVVRFNPREFVPAPAQGVVAWQTCTDDLPTRRLFQKIHNADVAAVTNIERGVLSLMNGGCHMPLGVYCERDAQGNYHVWAAKADTWDAPVRRVRVSSSTSFGLAEQVVAELNKAI